MIGAPPLKSQIQQASAFGQRASIDPAWMAFFTEVFKYIQAAQQSGTTAQRPTTNLYTARPYFDTDLNQPIWVGVDGETWVTADGLPA